MTNSKNLSHESMPHWNRFVKEQLGERFRSESNYNQGKRKNDNKRSPVLKKGQKRWARGNN